VTTDSTVKVFGERSERLSDIEGMYQESQKLKIKAMVKAMEGKWKEVYDLLLNALHLESEMEDLKRRSSL